MSYKYGRAALDLVMTDRVPRTEYSLTMHYDAMKAITGIDVSLSSSDEVKSLASKRTMELWNFDFMWATHIGGQIFGDKTTSMGHAEYAAEGSDRNDDIHEFITDPEEALDMNFYRLYGGKSMSELIKFFDESYDASAAYFPDAVNMTGIYPTAVSGLLNILGWDMLLLAAGTDQQAFGRLMQRYHRWLAQYYLALAESKAPVVMMHDDMVWTEGAFINPSWYRKYMFPGMKRFISWQKEAGKTVCFTSDGNYTEFFPDLVDMGIDCFVMEPMTDMKLFADTYGRDHSFVGNADTRILLSGSREDIYSEVKRCMDIGKQYPGFFMCVGNHIPPNTPVDSVLYYNECYEKLSHR